MRRRPFTILSGLSLLLLCLVTVADWVWSHFASVGLTYIVIKSDGALVANNVILHCGRVTIGRNDAPPGYYAPDDITLYRERPLMFCVSAPAEPKTSQAVRSGFMFHTAGPVFVDAVRIRAVKVSCWLPTLAFLAVPA